MAPIQRSINERQQLKAQERTLFPNADATASNNTTSATSSKAEVASANRALAKFNQSLEVSAHGVGLLRTLHKQVGWSSPRIYAVQILFTSHLW